MHAAMKWKAFVKRCRRSVLESRNQSRKRFFTRIMKVLKLKLEILVLINDDLGRPGVEAKATC